MQKLLETIGPAADPFIRGGAELARGLGEILHHFIPEAAPRSGRSQPCGSQTQGSQTQDSQPNPTEPVGRADAQTLEPAPASRPDRSVLLRGLRERLGDLELSLRVIAEGILGADAPIDFVTVDPGGRVQLVLVSSQGEDPAVVGQALAQRDWVSLRLRDWLKLSPELGIRPERGVGVVLLAPSFSSGVIAAAQAVEPDAATLVSYRYGRAGDPVAVALDTPAFRPRADSVSSSRSQHDPLTFGPDRSTAV
jgi:hypothetical protein